MLTRTLAAAIFALSFAMSAPSPAFAEDAKPDTRERAEEMARDAEKLAKEAIDRLMGALRTVIDSMPQYEAPEVLDNGDIIIRRKHPKDSPATDDAGPDVQETRT